MDHPKRQSLLADELANVIDTLHGLFDEIGLARYEREGREASVYKAISAALHDQLRQVSQEKTKMVEECHQLISQIKEMERSMADGDAAEFDDDDDDFKVTMPLTKCLNGLKERHKLIKRHHAERYDAIKKLAHALDTYASRLESSIVQVPLPPMTDDSVELGAFNLSPSYYERLEQEFERVYQEFTRRVSTVEALAKEIINLYAELGIPKAQIDRSIMEYGTTEPDRLGLMREDIERLRGKKTKLLDERQRRRAEAEEIKKEIKDLWLKLGINESDEKQFLARHRGCDLKCIQELEDELQRLLDLKRENLHVFVEDCRQTLQELWEKLYFSKDEIMDFAPARSSVYTDALLSAHEMEIARLEQLLEERGPILDLINKHRDLINDKEQLETSANDPSRLLGRGARDPTRLLREEKMRKRITRELPRIEVDLKKALEKWEEDYGAPMVVDGENYLETLIRLSPVAQSRATSNKTPLPGMRGRSKTVSAGTMNARSKSRPNVPEFKAPPPRSKTPSSRPKTPSGGALVSYQNPGVSTSRPKTPSGGALVSYQNSGASTVGRTVGRTIAGTVDRSGARTPALGGRIPQRTESLRTSSPTRLGTGRPPLSSLNIGNNIPERNQAYTTSTIGRNTSIKRGGSPATVLGSVPRMQPLPLQAQTQKQMSQYMRRQMEQERTEAASRQDTASMRSVRSVSPCESDDAEKNCGRPTKPKNLYRPRSEGFLHHYESSAHGSETSPSIDGRQFSNSTVSSLSFGNNSGSENWETYGDDSEGESEDAGAAYYHRHQKPKSSYGQGVSLVSTEEEYF